MLVPDVAGWRIDRLHLAPDMVGGAIPPDWACEVVSPSTVRLDRTRKMPVYAREGVRHLWLADPTARTLEVYHLEAGRWIVAGSHGGDESVRAEPFAALQIDLARWWLPTP